MPLPTTIPIHKPRGFRTGGLGSFCLFSTSFPFQDHVNRYHRQPVWGPGSTGTTRNSSSAHAQHRGPSCNNRA
ncbi:unnamed protein product [Coccothraustes coccothraustes]